MDAASGAEVVLTIAGWVGQKAADNWTSAPQRMVDAVLVLVAID